MTVLEEIEKIRKAEGDSLDYSIKVVEQAERTIPGWRVVNGRKGHMVTKIKLCARDVKREYYAEAKKVTVSSSETERTLLDGTKEKVVFHSYYIYVNHLSKNNKAEIEGGAITFREDKEYERCIEYKRRGAKPKNRVPYENGLLGD